jgi:hypothetical protein
MASRHEPLPDPIGVIDEASCLLAGIDRLHHPDKIAV